MTEGHHAASAVSLTEDQNSDVGDEHDEPEEPATKKCNTRGCKGEANSKKLATCYNAEQRVRDFKKGELYVHAECMFYSVATWCDMITKILGRSILILTSISVMCELANNLDLMRDALHL